MYRFINIIIIKKWKKKYIRRIMLEEIDKIFFVEYF